MDDVMLGLRVLLSLACVLGLLWYLARRLSGQGSGAARRRRTTPVTVVGRQSLGGKTGLALVEVGGRRLLLGVSEHGVNLLTEVEPEPEPQPGPAEVTELDPAALERMVADVPADISTLAALAPHTAGTTPALTHPSTTAARMPAVPTHRSPLEGSILDATVWRRAVAAVQERTIRR